MLCALCLLCHHRQHFDAHCCSAFTTAAPYEKKSSMDRKAELEKKKQKLAALRADKEKRRREKEAKDMEDATGRVVGGQDKDTRR